MSTTRFKIGFICLAVVLFFADHSYAENAETVYLDIGEWPPFTSEQEQDSKIAEVLVEEALKEVNLKVEFGYYPWKRSYERVRLGQSDGTFPWFINEDRGDHQYFIISNEWVIQDKEVFFYRKDRSFDWKNFDDLKKYTLGGVVGYSHVHHLSKQGIQLSVVSKEIHNLRKLMAGRIDASPSSQIVGYHLIQQEFPEHRWHELTHHPKALREDYMYIFFSKLRPKSREFEAAFSKGMKQLKASGRYSTIIEQFSSLSVDKPSTDLEQSVVLDFP